MRRDAEIFWSPDENCKQRTVEVSEKTSKERKRGPLNRRALCRPLSGGWCCQTYSRCLTSRLVISFVYFTIFDMFLLSVEPASEPHACVAVSVALIIIPVARLKYFLGYWNI